MTQDQFEIKDPEYAERVRGSFSRQAMMQTLGAALNSVRPGEVEIEMPFNAQFTQQHGFLHAAALTAVADSACGYAALSLMEPEREVLTIEYKVNFLSPAAGDRFIAAARVLRAGKNVTVCSAEVFAVQGKTRKLVAVMQATMIGLSAETVNEALQQ